MKIIKRLFTKKQKVYKACYNCGYCHSYIKDLYGVSKEEQFYCIKLSKEKRVSKFGWCGDWVSQKQISKERQL